MLVLTLAFLVDRFSHGDDGNGPVNQGNGLKPGDWLCPGCNFHNFASRVQVREFLRLEQGGGEFDCSNARLCIDWRKVCPERASRSQRKLRRSCSALPRFRASALPRNYGTRGSRRARC